MRMTSDGLDALLQESFEAARAREQSAFDAAVGTSSLILFGAGRLGRKIASTLRTHGVLLRGFSDNNPALWGTSVEGLEVFSPADAARQFGANSAFVVTIWHPEPRSPVLAIMRQLRELGCRRVVPFATLLWKYEAALLPMYFWDLPSRLLREADSIRTAFALLDDAASRETLESQLRFRLTAGFEALPAPVNSLQYFPPDFSLLPDEVFVDCGACDGDTIRSFAAQSKGRFRRIVALEPDPVNFARLASMIKERPDLRGRVEAHPFAVGARESEVRFAATGDSGAAIAESGTLVVRCRALDELLDGQAPSLIKMDVEGVESEALHGAIQSIRRHKPLLAICAYHRPQDLWRIPLLLHELEPDAQLRLRSHYADGFDLVCYAIPPERRCRAHDTRCT